MSYQRENGHGEDTRRVKIAVHSEMDDQVRAIKRWYAIGAIVLIVLGVGFGAREYFTRYATAETVKELAASHESVKKALSDHVLSETVRLERIETQAEDHAKWEEKQVGHIAVRIGATRVPAPIHERINP